MRDRGWLALHFSPCAALRSCGRLDEHWCRARNATCNFPQVSKYSVSRCFTRAVYRRRSSFNLQPSCCGVPLLAWGLLPTQLLPAATCYVECSQALTGPVQVAQADMLDVVRQRPDLRWLLRLMYADTSNGGTFDSGGSGNGSGSNADSRNNFSIAAGSSTGSSSRSSSRGPDGSGESIDSSAAEAWRAAAGWPTPQQGQMGEAVMAATASLVNVMNCLSSPVALQLHECGIFT